MKQRKNTKGSAMVVVTVTISSVAILSLTLLATTGAASSERKSAQRTLGAIYVAEAGLNEALMNLASAGDGNLGSDQNQVPFGRGSFFVETVPGANDTFTLTARARDNGQDVGIELTVRQPSRAFYQWAAFGDEGMTMDSNARTDSYDSTLGTYGSQDVNGAGNSTYALSNGDVGSNMDVEMLQNSTVHGDVTPGPAGVANVLGTAVVTGVTLPAPNTADMPPLNMPVLPSSGDWTVSSSTTLPSGDHAYDELTIDTGETLTIVGPATLLLEDFLLNSNAELIVDATNGPVEIYVEDDFVMDSNTIIGSTTSDPSDLQLYLESNNIVNPNLNVILADIAFNSNSEFYGTIYAPNAHIDIDSNFQLFGSVVARSVHLDSNSRIHFDENLLRANANQAGGAFEAICWRMIANP